MKLDKDTLVKHQFWVLLGSFFLVWILAVSWLSMSAGDPIKAVKDKYTASVSKLTTASRNPKNPNTFCPPWEEYSTVIDKHKRSIWGQAWDLQNGMYSWPAELSKNKDMSTPQTELTPGEREQYKRDLYPEEVKNLKVFVEGDAKKKYVGLLGPVELAGGFDNIFKPQKWENTPTREECWLAQEDYWVKRELFYVVSNAMASQSYMYPTAPDEKTPLPAGVLYRFQFRNQNWEITLYIKATKEKLLVIAGDSTIKNIQPSRHVQTLTSAKGAGIVFNVFQDKMSIAFEVRGEPVAWNAVQKLNPEHDYPVLKGIDWSKTKEHPIGMSQAFDWFTCPIRRIEAMTIGQQSCRTFTSPLQPNEALVKLDAPKEDPTANKENPAPAPGAPGMPGAPGAGMPGAPPGMAGNQRPGAGQPGAGGGMLGQKSDPVGNPTPNNNIERNRYLQPPKKEGNDAGNPSRHLPLALQLIVDQSHMGDLLVALANSRLRMQITQVEFHRVRDVKPESADKDDGNTQLLRTGYMPPGMGMMPPGMGSGRMRPGMGSGRMTPGMGSGQMRPGMGSGRMPPGMGGMMPPGMGGFGRPSMRPGIVMPTGMMPRNPRGGPLPGAGDPKDAKTAPSQGDENLVQMTVYGIATLYRRPDPAATPAQSGQPSQPVGVPPAGAPR